jgi:sn-glycerol 3-phosphate transport system substrate-binding protein
VRIRPAVLFGLTMLVMIMTVQAGLASKTELLLWHHWDGNRGDLVQEQLDRFMAENPDIEAKQQMTPPASTADKLVTLLISGAAPEIMMVRSSYASQIIRGGGFLQLDDLMKNDGISASAFIPADIYPFQLDGKTYALPVMSGAAWTNLMFYNRRLMAESGLPERAPETWAEWREMSLRMTKHDTEGRLVTAGTDIPDSVSVAHWNAASLWSDDWKTATIVDNPRVIETVTFLKELLEKQYETYSGYTGFNGSGFANAFFMDRLGFSTRNSSAFNHLPETGIDWGVGLAPRSDLHDDTAPMGLVLSTWAYAIPADIPRAKLEPAWRLFKWLTADERAAGWFARVQGRPSPIMRFNQHRDYRLTNPYWDVVIKSTEHVALAPPVGTGRVTSMLTRFITGQMHLQQALAEAELALQLELDAYWK